MSHFHSHFNTARSVIQQYTGDMPLNMFLKKFFSQEKKYGSRDRKSISALCYNYYRSGAALNGRTIEERLLISNFLCSQEQNEMLEKERPELNEKAATSLREKLILTEIEPKAVFLWNGELSDAVEAEDFNLSFFVQPDLFIRIRPGKQTVVTSKLKAAGIQFREIDDACLALDNGIKLEQALEMNKDLVIQDLNSQRTGQFMLPTMQAAKTMKMWDCCAASGGKTILAFDLFKDCELTVSDIRQPIIQNLNIRLKAAGVRKYTPFVADITNEEAVKKQLDKTKFDLVICDAPCSGSGTWSRTPEQLLFFKKDEINRYSNLQKKIVCNTLPYVEKGGYFLYITCSVFRKENEEVVEFIKDQFNLSLVKMELLKGYNSKADSMFAALFKIE